MKGYALGFWRFSGSTVQRWKMLGFAFGLGGSRLNDCRINGNLSAIALAMANRNQQ